MVCSISGEISLLGTDRPGTLAITVGRAGKDSTHFSGIPTGQGREGTGKQRLAHTQAEQSRERPRPERRRAGRTAGRIQASAAATQARFVCCRSVVERRSGNRADDWRATGQEHCYCSSTSRVHVCTIYPVYSCYGSRLRKHISSPRTHSHLLLSTVWLPSPQSADLWRKTLSSSLDLEVSETRGPISGSTLAQRATDFGCADHHPDSYRPDHCPHPCSQRIQGRGRGTQPAKRLP